MATTSAAAQREIAELRGDVRDVKRDVEAIRSQMADIKIDIANRFAELKVAIASGDGELKVQMSQEERDQTVRLDQVSTKTIILWGVLGLVGSSVITAVLTALLSRIGKP